MIGDRIAVNIAGGLEVSLPRMVDVRQKFKTERIDSVSASVTAQFRHPDVRDSVKPGMTIAVGCGSRGIANIAECIRTVIAELRHLGALPFSFPAMGSHGAATAQGQRKVLESYGITEATMGCPLVSSMDVVKLGTLDDRTPIWFDKAASEADAVALVCRVKPHTNFRAPFESGIVKMLVIGAGKIMGATAIHRHGFENFKEVLPQAGRVILHRLNCLFGEAMVENAMDETRFEVLGDPQPFDFDAQGNLTPLPTHVTQSRE
jgi:hypothetical protein